MSKKPTISVVMTVYNGEKYLRDAIDSILNQTFKDFEFIIINDGSTDETPKILKSYKDPRIIVVNQENIGFTKSLNKGIELAKGKFIARQDDDDISMPERLEKQFDFFKKHKNVALLGTAAKIIDSRGIDLQTIELPSDHITICKGMKRYNPFIHGSVMFKQQSFFDLGGYREFFSTSQDYDLWLRFSEKYEVANLSKTLYKRRINPRSLTFKKIILQRKLRKFAKMLANAREKGISESLLIKELKIFLDSNLSVAEKQEVFRNYNRWCLLLLLKHNKNEAFLLMEEGIKLNPSRFYKSFFKISKIFQSAFLFRMLILLRILFHWLKKEKIQSNTNSRSTLIID